MALVGSEYVAIQCNTIQCDNALQCTSVKGVTVWDLQCNGEKCNSMQYIAMSIAMHCNAIQGKV